MADDSMCTLVFDGRDDSTGEEVRVEKPKGEVDPTEARRIARRARAPYGGRRDLYTGTKLD